MEVWGKGPLSEVSQQCAFCCYWPLILHVRKSHKLGQRFIHIAKIYQSPRTELNSYLLASVSNLHFAFLIMAVWGYLKILYHIIILFHLVICVRLSNFSWDISLQSWFIKLLLITPAPNPNYQPSCTSSNLCLL